MGEESKIKRNGVWRTPTKAEVKALKANLTKFNKKVRDEAERDKKRLEAGWTFTFEPAPPGEYGTPDVVDGGPPLQKVWHKPTRKPPQKEAAPSPPTAVANPLKQPLMDFGENADAAKAGK